MFSYLRFIFLIIFFHFTQIHALSLFDASLDIIGGYRNDELTTLIHAFNPPETFILSDDLQAKNIRVFEVGLKGRTLIYDCLAMYGYALFGQVYSGHYTDTQRNPQGNPNGLVAASHADIHGGETRDFSIGIGYLYPVFYCIHAGPTAGWSYNELRIKMNHAHTNNEPNPILDDLQYENRWQGPWIGLEGNFDLVLIQVNLGYEYHFGNWNADWDLSGPDIFGGSFSDKRHSNQVSGNVVYLEANYHLITCCELGLALKYQYWKAKDGKEEPKAGSFASIGYPATEVDHVPHATWKSFEIILSTGFCF